MTTERQTIQTEWNSAARITAAEDTAVLIRETEGEDIFWAITDDDTAPSMAVHLGQKISKGDQVSITIATGERLWLATRQREITCTLTKGAIV